MASAFSAGDAVQTPLGKGIVREPRGRDHVLVEVNGRAVVLEERALKRLDSPGTAKRKKKTTDAAAANTPAALVAGTGRSAEVDLHGLTVQEALARAEQAVNDALLADASQLRLIHGRSGGRIRAALHQWLRETPSVRGYRLDPRNPGVTIVSF